MQLWLQCYEYISFNVINQYFYNTKNNIFFAILYFIKRMKKWKNTLEVPTLLQNKQHNAPYGRVS